MEVKLAQISGVVVEDLNTTFGYVKKDETRDEIEPIKENIDKYTFLIEKSNRNEINGIIKCNFNIGVILINYLLIKRRYKREKTS